ncbi:hypothetical protein NC652_028709 [Populus alba x Populus x berolinensis]|nr:hypothetical protein NC652_028709 [Populus alba x Populus x berolinensis]
MAAKLFTFLSRLIIQICKSKIGCMTGFFKYLIVTIPSTGMRLNPEEASFRDLGVSNQSGKDLRALKQILEAMQAKEALGD